MSPKPEPSSKKLPPPTRSEAAFERRLAALSGVEEPAAPRAPVDVRARPDGLAGASFLDNLFANSDAYLGRDRYATIGDAWSFNTKLAGVSHNNRQDLAEGLAIGDALAVRRQPENEFDSNAILVTFGVLEVGYINRDMAKRLAPLIDVEGRRYSAVVTAITGGRPGQSRGVNIRLTRDDAPATSGSVVERREDADVRAALIGDRPMREAQIQVLERLDAGKNVLAVMGTGRGKSFCFQYPAAKRALQRGEKTLVLYPLRALANDQYEAMRKRLGPLGLRIFRANGAIDGAERAALMAALESGDWDIVCSTPEFVRFHGDRFTTPQSRPSLVVVDEAHHIHEATHRPAYSALATSLAALGTPQVLALTATAGDDAFDHLRRELAIEAWVIDATIRSNLHIVDARETKDKARYLLDLLRDSGKAIVYCNSRTEATKTAEKLRASFGDEVAFYHAGVPSAERSQVETLFREGALRIIVATSAFGEGIDLPDVRNVVLYHLNFDFIEFNQQSGRAGRDGEPAQIHLLFGEKDRRINDYIIAKSAPALGTLRELYRGMRGMSRDGVLHSANADIASTLDLDLADGTTVAIALRIFADANLIAVEEDEGERVIRFLETTQKIDLTKTARFAEGQAERESFERFCTLVSSAKSDVLESIVNRPIYPQNVALLR